MGGEQVRPLLLFATLYDVHHQPGFVEVLFLGGGEGRVEGGGRGVAQGFVCVMLRDDDEARSRERMLATCA